MNILTLILVAVAASALADTPAETRDWHTHIQDAKTNVDIKNKAGEAIAALKLRVIEIIADNQKQLDDTADNLLSDEQKCWEAWATARARLISDTYRGGSHQGLAFSYELINLYLARIHQLKRLREDLKP